jgi:soluble lytic murein transglycosylase-like protein
VWLVRQSGALAGIRYPLRGEITRIGRGDHNDIVFDDEESSVVSGSHLEVRLDGGVCRIRDVGSTNGTYLNGERIAEGVLEPGGTVRLGASGPELALAFEAAVSASLDQTMVVPAESVADAAPKSSPAGTFAGEEEALLARAVAQARMARRTGLFGQTHLIMRDAVRAALRRTNRRHRRVIAVLAAALVLVSAAAAWKITALHREKRGIDARIREIQATLNKASVDPATLQELADSLDRFENQAQAIQRNVLYRFGVRGQEREDFVTAQIRVLMAEFGAEVYSIPPEFVERVKHYIGEYQGPNRPHMLRALGRARADLEAMRRVFEEESLPPDLAYMVLVESAFAEEGASRAGAAGLWQFTAPTARAYGLRVGDGVDERLDSRKATRAACKYVRELILDFGAGSSVMLALAAYNLGPSRVKQAVRKVQDPIKQRSFWYLYRVRALPAETREYVPKVIAAMTIGRAPDKFGF